MNEVGNESQLLLSSDFLKIGRLEWFEVILLASKDMLFTVKMHFYILI